LKSIAPSVVSTSKGTKIQLITKKAVETASEGGQNKRVFLARSLHIVVVLRFTVPYNP
jgi:ABC-type Mn2+/Zn2+ transport system ATPase subunit